MTPKGMDRLNFIDGPYCMLIYLYSIPHFISYFLALVFYFLIEGERFFSVTPKLKRVCQKYHEVSYHFRWQIKKNGVVKAGYILTTDPFPFIFLSANDGKLLKLVL